MLWRSRGVRIMAEPLRYSEALQRVRELGRELASRGADLETVPTAEAAGRILAETLRCEEIIPPFANSAVDGFAVHSELTREASATHPVRLPVVGWLIAGDRPPASPAQSGVWEVMTGAAVPSGFDSMLKVEDVEVLRDSAGRAIEILLREPAVPGMSVRPAGEDFQIGSELLQQGTLITPEHLVAIATVGIAQIRVRRRPKAAFLSTGAEVVSLGEPLPLGKIRNSTAPFLSTALERLGLEVKSYDAVGDDPMEFRLRMKRILADQPDLIITTGAVSMGKHDFVTEEIPRLGGEVLFHKVSIRPGKPILCARLKGSAFFGLPGNAVSTVVGTRFFVAPLVRALLGQPEESPLRARLKNRFKKPKGLRCFFKARFESTLEGAEVTTLPGQASNLVGGFLQSNAWVIFPEEPIEMAAGDVVEVLPV